MNGDQLGAEANDWLQPWFGPEELSTREGTSNGEMHDHERVCQADFADAACTVAWGIHSRL
jgi:hypothetical protein